MAQNTKETQKVTYAIRCSKCGLSDFVDAPGRHKCSGCGVLCTAYQAGVPKEAGLGKPRPPFKMHYSWQHGRKLTSWSDYHSANKEMGLVDTGRKPERSYIPSSRVSIVVP